MPKKTSKQVPLVIYKSGERIQIGMASIGSDGEIIGQIAKDIREDVKALLWGNIGDVSLNPKKPLDLKYTSTFVDAKTQEPVEVAVVAPLKIQE